MSACMCRQHLGEACTACASQRPPKTRERVAQCEDAITHLMRRVESLEARSPGHYSPEPQNHPTMWMPPIGGTSSEED